MIKITDRASRKIQKDNASSQTKCCKVGRAPTRHRLDLQHTADVALRSREMMYDDARATDGNVSQLAIKRLIRHLLEIIIFTSFHIPPLAIH